jgi:hypothetical protein
MSDFQLHHIDIGTLNGIGKWLYELAKDTNALSRLSVYLKGYNEKIEFQQMLSILSEIKAFYIDYQNAIKYILELKLNSESQEDTASIYFYNHVQSGNLLKTLREVRMRCGNIYKIWYGYEKNRGPPSVSPSSLQWLLSLNKEEKVPSTNYEEVSRLFYYLSDSDDDLVKIIESTNNCISEYSNVILSLIRLRKVKDAEDYLIALQDEIRDFMYQLGQCSNQLQTTGEDFIEETKLL